MIQGGPDRSLILLRVPLTICFPISLLLYQLLFLFASPLSTLKNALGGASHIGSCRAAGTGAIAQELGLACLGSQCYLAGRSSRLRCRILGDGIKFS
mgnify:CR=1 FL=1